MEAEALDFNMDFEDGQQSEADKRLLVAFYTTAVKNEQKSIEAGRPVFDSIDMVKIITPGQRDSFVGDATEDYQRRFPRQWARFKAGKEQVPEGTPLSSMPWLSVGQVEEYKYVGVHTVEQLVGMADSVAHKFMGHSAVKQRAQSYLDAAKGAAPLLKMQAELEKRDAQLGEQATTIAALAKRLEELEKEAKAAKDKG